MHIDERSDVTHSVMEVNLFGTISLTKAFLELIRESKGRVINVSSLAGVVAVGLFSGYSATKFATEGFTDSLRKEMLPLGVSVSLINPGQVVSKMFEKDINELKANQETFFDKKWESLYGSLVLGAVDKIKDELQSASPTEVTTNAIKQAAFEPRPSARYYVAGSDGFPSIVVAFMARVFPAYLNDRLVEIFRD